mmetsp:Transcript_132959/g.331713  ORF Transcript_132959/g.331713 Transcript_132959/m.331713 type:complete len:214 (-) Transcript_132959:220-861(-)
MARRRRRNRMTTTAVIATLPRQALRLGCQWARTRPYLSGTAQSLGASPRSRRATPARSQPPSSPMSRVRLRTEALRGKQEARMIRVKRAEHMNQIGAQTLHARARARAHRTRTRAEGRRAAGATAVVGAIAAITIGTGVAVESAAAITAVALKTHMVARLVSAQQPGRRRAAHQGMAPTCIRSRSHRPAPRPEAAAASTARQEIGRQGSSRRI